MRSMTTKVGIALRNLRAMEHVYRGAAAKASCDEEDVRCEHVAQRFGDGAEAAENLLGWISRWQGLPRVSITNDGAGREVPESEIDTALRGDPPPKTERQRKVVEPNAELMNALDVLHPTRGKAER